MSIRVCHPFDLSVFYKFNAETNMFDGTIGEIVTDGMDWLIRGMKIKDPNTTMIVQPNFEIGALDPKTGRYNGCLGRLQTNQSDLHLQLTRYPLLGDNFTQGMVIYDTAITISGAYRLRDPGETAQISRSFASFSFSLWCLCLFTVFTLYFILKLRNNLRVKKTRTHIRHFYPLYYICCHCVRLNQISDRGVVRKIIFYCASIFSLIVVHCFFSLIKTEFVVVKKPQVFNSYDDIIKRNVTPVFMKGTVYDTFFREPDAPSYRRQMWRQQMRDRSDAGMYIDSNLFSYMAHSIRLLDQKSVFISEGPLANALVATGCTINGYEIKKILEMGEIMGQPEQAKLIIKSMDLTPKEEESVLTVVKLNSGLDLHGLTEFYIHSAVDPREKYFSQGIIASRFMSRENSILKWFQKACEIGLTVRIQKQIQGMDLLEGNPLITQLMGLPLTNRNNQVKNCRSESIFTKDSEFRPLSLINYKTFVHSCTFLLCLAYMILLIERGMFR